MKAVSGISATSLTPVSIVFPSRDGQITAILDQKNYVEELNRHLNSRLNRILLLGACRERKES